jgi:hypothetical protein
MIIYFPKPRLQRMNQFTRQTVFVIFVALDKSSKRRAGDDAHVAVEGVFVFLIRDERMNLAAADERDVSGLGASEIFLQENALGIIDVPQPRARVGDGLAQNRVDRTRRRAERIFDDERPRIFSASILFEATNDFGNGILNFAHNSRAKSRSRSILIASPVGEKIPTPDFIKSFAHGCKAQSMDCGMTTSIFFSRISGTGLGNESREKVSPTRVGEKCP